MTDPAQRWKTFPADALGNLVHVTGPNPAGGTFDTCYSYNDSWVIRSTRDHAA